MSIEVVMPAFGLVMESGKIIRWLKKEGEAVGKGDPIVEIETNKVTVEIESSADGVLNIIASSGVEIAVGKTIAFIYTAEEYQTAIKNVPEAAEEFYILPDIYAVSLGERPKYFSSSEVKPFDRGKSVLTLSESDLIVKASPAAKKLAKELNVDLTMIAGTGPGGRVTQEDVLSYNKKLNDKATLPAWKIVPMSSSRKITAERMYNSSQSTAPVTLYTTVRMNKVIEMREIINRDLIISGSFKVNFDSIFAKTVVMSLKDFPELQAQWTPDGLHYPEVINIGIAIALPDKLVVPVITDCEGKSLLSIASEVQNLVQLARENKLMLSHFENGTFTITNLGMYQIDTFSPIINHPEAAILGIGCIKEQVLVEKGQFIAGKTIGLSLTFDHRIVDGAPASAFLRNIKTLLEEPASLFSTE